MLQRESRRDGHRRLARETQASTGRIRRCTLYASIWKDSLRLRRDAWLVNGRLLPSTAATTWPVSRNDEYPGPRMTRRDRVISSSAVLSSHKQINQLDLKSRDEDERLSDIAGF
jgi:hypothetical protein